MRQRQPFGRSGVGKRDFKRMPLLRGVETTALSHDVCHPASTRIVRWALQALLDIGSPDLPAATSTPIYCSGVLELGSRSIAAELCARS